MRRTAATVLCLSLALTGCRAKELADKNATANDPDKRGIVDSIQAVADDQYTPPQDGKLTDAHVEMYLKVREHEKKIAQAAKEDLKKHSQNAEKNEKSIAGVMEGLKAIGSAADFMTADIRAAKELGFNTQEYLWVKTQILAVSASAMTKKMSEAVSANFDQAYQQAKKAFDEAKDEQTRKLYADMLAGYEKSKQEMQQNAAEEPALAYNRQLLSKHENALNAYAHELSKYEEKDGDVQKAMDELQKKVEEAKNH